MEPAGPFGPPPGRRGGSVGLQQPHVRPQLLCRSIGCGGSGSGSGRGARWRRQQRSAGSLSASLRRGSGGGGGCGEAAGRPPGAQTHPNGASSAAGSPAVTLCRSSPRRARRQLAPPASAAARAAVGPVAATALLPRCCRRRPVWHRHLPGCWGGSRSSGRGRWLWRGHAQPHRPHLSIPQGTQAGAAAAGERGHGAQCCDRRRHGVGL
jgi:hypothetical protein